MSYKENKELTGKANCLETRFELYLSHLYENITRTELGKQFSKKEIKGVFVDLIDDDDFMSNVKENIIQILNSRYSKKY